MSPLRAVRGLAVACALALAPLAALAQTFPPLTGRVVDQANVLSPETEAAMTQKLAALEAKNTNQLVVATVPSLQGYEIEDFGYRLLRHWGIGQKDENNGVIFLVAPTERRVRIEVGYGLEPVLTDALSSIILRERVLPRFREGDVEGGVVAGVDAVAEQLGLDPAAAAQRVAQAEEVEAPSAAFDPVALIIIFFVGLWILSTILRAVGLRGRRRRRGGGLLPIILWSIAESAASSSRRGGGWGGGGGFGGGGFGGGGFSGGGGSGGGGGASGGW